MKELTLNIPVNPTADDLNSMGLLALLRKEQILHIVPEETSSAIEMHSHNRQALGMLDVKMYLPLGDASTNVTPSLFEAMVADVSGKTLSISDVTDPKVIFDVDKAGHTIEAEPEKPNAAIRNPFAELNDEVRIVTYSTFIIREECDIEKHHGQMLPWRFVQVVWAYEEGIPLEEQIAMFDGVKIYEPSDPEIAEYLTVNGNLLDEYAEKQAKKLEEEVNAYLDSIGLDYDYPNLETDVDKELLKEAAVNYPSVRDQAPNNPFHLPRAPRTMSDDERVVYALCYNENVDLYNPDCSIKPDENDLDKDALAFCKDKIKARIGIYHPDDLPDDISGTWGEDIVRVHRSVIFVPITHFNVEFMSHLNDDCNRRLEELDMFFEELSKEVAGV